MPAQVPPQPETGKPCPDLPSDEPKEPIRVWEPPAIVAEFSLAAHAGGQTYMLGALAASAGNMMESQQLWGSDPALYPAGTCF